MSERPDRAAARRSTGDDAMEDLEAVNLAADWSDISQGLRKDLGHQLHSQWIKPIQLGQLCAHAGAERTVLSGEHPSSPAHDREVQRGDGRRRHPARRPARPAGR